MKEDETTEQSAAGEDDPQRDKARVEADVLDTDDASDAVDEDHRAEGDVEGRPSLPAPVGRLGHRIALVVALFLGLGLGALFFGGASE